MKKLSVLVLILFLAACTKAGMFRINSVPDNATVYVDGVYAGVTPYTVHTEWYDILGIPVGDRFHLTVDKEGYNTVEMDTSVKERKAYKGGAAHKSGANPAGKSSVTQTESDSIYTFTFPLEPKAP
ncbi:MAG: PEGA domain-containing protein [Syntrophobacterales bacterium]|jgi:hypothetical protein|nr:PEGA domain-containing protein [Syntrophobacterales bacterium]